MVTSSLRRVSCYTVYACRHTLGYKLTRFAAYSQLTTNTPNPMAIRQSTPYTQNPIHSEISANFSDICSTTTIRCVTLVLTHMWRMPQRIRHNIKEYQHG